MSRLKRYCQAIDLKDDPELIAEYEEYHKKIWPEIVDHLKSLGIEKMEIWRVGTRLFMIMDVNELYDPLLAEEMSLKSKINQEWETLMSKYQRVTPWVKNNQKWCEMVQIFNLEEQ